MPRINKEQLVDEIIGVTIITALGAALGVILYFGLLTTV